MRKMELSLMQAPVLVAALLIGCGQKISSDAALVDTAETDADGNTDVDGSVDDGAGTDADDGAGTDGGADADADGGPDTGSDTGTTADGSDADGGDADGGDADGSSAGGETDSGDSGGSASSGPTIRDVQNGLFSEDEIITLENVVVSSPSSEWPDGFYIADLDGGEKSGLWVYSDWLDDDEEVTLSVGQVIDITGAVSEYAPSSAGDGPFPSTETLTQMRIETSSDIRMVMTGSVPAAETVTTAMLSDPASAEPWESVLVSVSDVTITATADDTLSIGDGVTLSDAFNDELRVGDTLTSLRGIVEFTNGKFKLAPRSSADFSGLATLGSTGSCSATKCAGDLEVGDIAITEIMNNPGAGCGGGSAGEYIEVYNASGVDIDLAGLGVSDLARDTFISSSVTVAAGAYAVLEYAEDAPCIVSSSSTFSWATYDSVQLNDGSDESIVLSFGGTELDRVEFETSWPSSDGTSMQLNSTASSTSWASTNDAEENWCASTSAIGGTTSGAADLGTPGAASDCG